TTLTSEKCVLAARIAGMSLARTEFTVGAAVARTRSTCTLLNLSVNTVARPWAVRAHPSGTFTVNPPPGGDHGTYTWVTGMAPGGFESAGAGAVEVRACCGGEAEEEQAAAPAPATSTRPAA